MTSFEARLSDPGPFGLEVPAEIVEAFGAGKRVPAWVTIGDHSYRSTVAPYRGPYMIPLSYENASAAGVAAGQTITVEIVHDTAPRVVEVPSDLQAALDRSTSAQAAWSKLSFSHQNAHVLAINDAKTEETRARRVASAIEKLGGQTAER